MVRGEPGKMGEGVGPKSVKPFGIGYGPVQSLKDAFLALTAILPSVFGGNSKDDVLSGLTNGMDS